MSRQFLRTQIKMNEKAIDTPGKWGINNCFFLPIWIWKGRDNMKFYFPPLTRLHRDLGRLTLVRILTLFRPLPFSRECHLQALKRLGCPSGTHPGHQKLRPHTGLSFSRNQSNSDAKSRLIGKDLVAGKDQGQEEKGATEDEMVGWYHWLNGHEFEQTLGDSEE